MAVALAAGGPAQAAPHRVGTAAAGVISTVAGGVGGPARATRVGLTGVGNFELNLRGIGFGAGRLYIADTWSVRAVNPQTDRLTTPAGTGAFGPLGDGGPAVSAYLGDASAVAVDGAGNLLITDGDTVRVVAASTGTFYGQAMTARDIYTIAGGGGQGFSGDGGPATSAALNLPQGVAADAAGNLLIADAGNGRVRVVAASTGTFYGQAMTAGDIYTVAGNGTVGYSGDGGPATAAQLNSPHTIAVDAAGNLVIADTGSNRIRVVAASTGTFYGQAMTAGDIYTIAGNGTSGFSGDGGPATAAELSQPAGVTADAAGNLLIADAGNQRVRVVAASSSTFYGQAMTAGDIYTVAGDGTRGFTGDGGPATAAELHQPASVTVDGAGNLLIADARNGRVRVVAASTGTFYGQPMTGGDIYTIAGDGTRGFTGDGGPATAAELHQLGGAAVDGAGDLLIITLDNVVVVAASSGTLYGRTVTAGRIYNVARRVPLKNPMGVALDGAGNLLIADTDSNRIRVMAASTGTFYGQAMTAGDIYTIAGNGTRGFGGDGGPATSAELNRPGGVATDGAGNLLIADQGSNRIRVVAASTSTFYGQAMTAGDIYTIAGNGTRGFGGDGGRATAAELDNPISVAVDNAGNLLISDFVNQRVRVVAASTGTFYGQAMTAGDIYTIAGNGTEGFSGDGGPATAAELCGPYGMAVDSTGNLLIAAGCNERIRVVAASTGTFYGQAMTAGDIYTIAGNGTRGFTGDGGPATAAELGSPISVAVDNAGDLLIADQGSGRIREVTGSGAAGPVPRS